MSVLPMDPFLLPVFSLLVFKHMALSLAMPRMILVNKEHWI